MIINIQIEDIPMTLKTRISKLVEIISQNMHEREEIIAVSLLGALSGQNTFLYGPPGTAKSLISRRLASAFDKPSYFECLMNRFTTPEEVVGPVSIKALKEDQYTRKTHGYLPEAEFAFLDEIWKSSPAILNTLLTLINEHTFRNGEEIVDVPLKALIAASNETPEPNQGLDALYDRFIIRMLVPPIEHKQHFDELISSKPSSTDISVPKKYAITQTDWESWQKRIHEVALSEECITIIHLIRNELQEKHEELNIYVSDRRWQRAAILMKASAFFSDRKVTNHSDALLLQYCLWTSETNREQISKIVKSAIKASGFETENDLSGLFEKKEALGNEINNELYHTEDQFDTKVLKDGKEYFKQKVKFEDHYNGPHQRTVYISRQDYRSKSSTEAVDANGNKLEDISVNFNGNSSCVLVNSNRTLLLENFHS